MTELEARKLITSCPGDSVEEFAEELGLNRAELAGLLDLSPAELAALLEGKTAIRPELAAKLGALFGTSAAFWLNLERSYQQNLAEIARLKAEAASRPL